MKNWDAHLKQNLQKLKVYEINKLKKLEREQQEFFQEIRENILGEITRKKSMDDLLSPKQIMIEVGISRKTFDRWVNDGLPVLQRETGKCIRVKRVDMEYYLKDKHYVR